MAFLHNVKNIVKSIGLGELYKADIENEKVDFDPEKYPNIALKYTGHMHGTITIYRADHDELKTVQIVNKIFVTDEYIKVTITPEYDGDRFVLKVEGPDYFTKVRHETELTFPRSLKNVESFSINTENANIEAMVLSTLFFDRYEIFNVNGNIDSKLIKSTNTTLKTHNGNITGTYQPLGKFIAECANGTVDSSVTSSTQPSTIDLKTNNGSIKGFYRLATSLNARTTNGSVTIQGHLKQDETIDAELSSTNGSVGLSLSKVYQGGFQLETSWGPTNVSELVDVKFDTYNRSVKTGKKGIGSGSIKLSTTNGGAKLEFV